MQIFTIPGEYINVLIVTMHSKNGRVFATLKRNVIVD